VNGIINEIVDFLYREEEEEKPDTNFTIENEPGSGLEAGSGLLKTPDDVLLFWFGKNFYEKSSYETKSECINSFMKWFGYRCDKDLDHFDSKSKEDLDVRDESLSLIEHKKLKKLIKKQTQLVQIVQRNVQLELQQSNGITMTTTTTTKDKDIINYKSHWDNTNPMTSLAKVIVLTQFSRYAVIDTVSDICIELGCNYIQNFLLNEDNGVKSGLEWVLRTYRPIERYFINISSTDENIEILNSSSSSIEYPSWLKLVKVMQPSTTSSDTDIDTDTDEKETIVDESDTLGLD